MSFIQAVFHALGKLGGFVVAAHVVVDVGTQQLLRHALLHVGPLSLLRATLKSVPCARLGGHALGYTHD